jgi:hypothetical protein
MMTDFIPYGRTDLRTYIALHCIVHCIVLHCIVLHCIVLHCIVHCIALHTD